MAVQLDCEGVITWILPSDNADEAEELSSCQETVKPDTIKSAYEEVDDAET
jgi:hypothetical protein